MPTAEPVCPLGVPSCQPPWQSHVTNFIYRIPTVRDFGCRAAWRHAKRKGEERNSRRAASPVRSKRLWVSCDHWWPHPEKKAFDRAAEARQHKSSGKRTKPGKSMPKSPRFNRAHMVTNNRHRKRAIQFKHFVQTMTHVPGRSCQWSHLWLQQQHSGQTL